MYIFPNPKLGLSILRDQSPFSFTAQSCKFTNVFKYRDIGSGLNNGFFWQRIRKSICYEHTQSCVLADSSMGQTIPRYRADCPATPESHTPEHIDDCLFGCSTCRNTENVSFNRRTPLKYSSGIMDSSISTVNSGFHDFWR